MTAISYAVLALLSVFVLASGGVLLSVFVLAFGGEKLHAVPYRAELHRSFDPSAIAWPEPRFSMGQFEQMARDKTRTQIIDEYGPPDEVGDNGNSWLYYNLKVYDENLVDRLTARIRFAGIGEPMDFVAVVEFR